MEGWRNLKSPKRSAFWDDLRKALQQYAAEQKRRGNDFFLNPLFRNLNFLVADPLSLRNRHF